MLYSHHYRNIKKIYFNYNNVRPEGERLKTFGGHASGHQSIKRMFDKIDKLLDKKTEDKVQLKPIDCLDIANIIGENVVSGGVRRTSEVGLFDKDDDDILEAKNNLYYQEDGQWKLNEELSHRQMSNNSIMYFEKPTREQLHWQIEQMRYSGEPGFMNAGEAMRRRDNAEGGNPCFTGDMKLLTDKGYQRFDKLSGENVNVVNRFGEITEGKVWETGVKNIVEIEFYNRESIKSTPDHQFMTNDGKTVEAKDLKGKRIMPYLEENKNDNKSYQLLGFIQGDGALGRLNSKTHQGLEIFVGENDDDIKKLLPSDGEWNSDNIAYYTNAYNDWLKALKFDSSPLPDRELPKTFYNWDNESQRINFIKGLYSANGSVIGQSGNGRITLKSTSIKLIQQVKDYLETLGYSPYFTINKSKNVEFNNGNYTCKESYDLNLGQYQDKKKFYEEIGFVQQYKNNKLKEYIIKTAPCVKNIIPKGKETVYDFSEPVTHWGVVEDVIAHNCMEIILDDNGMCNLVSLNVFAFVNEDGTIDREAMLNSQRLNARSAYRMALVEFELPDWDYVNKRDRLIGLSLTGWQDMVNATDLSKQGERALLQELRIVANNSAEEVAKEHNDEVPVLVTTIKPEGTQTQMPTVSSGLHYNHSPYYIRRVRISSNDPLAYAAEEMGWVIKAENGQDAENPQTVVIEFPVKAPKGKVKGDVSAIEQLETYKMFMENYVDHNASITVHVRDDEWDAVEEWMWENWNSVVGISFISYDDSFYELMPYEEITKKEYNKRVKQMEEFKPHIINYFEKMSEERELGNISCDTGVCPVR